jgi:hypothetical protein
MTKCPESKTIYQWFGGIHFVMSIVCWSTARLTLLSPACFRHRAVTCLEARSIGGIGPRLPELPQAQRQRSLVILRWILKTLMTLASQLRQPVLEEIP